MVDVVLRGSNKDVASRGAKMSKYEELKVKLRDWRLSLQSDNKEAMLLAANAIESLERQLAKQDVEIARLKTVPMKYRRMEFNAQLQHKNTKLEAQLATVTAQRDLLKDALEKLFSWVDAYAETSDTEFPTVERLCVEALASLKGE